MEAQHTTTTTTTATATRMMRDDHRERRVYERRRARFVVERMALCSCVLSLLLLLAATTPRSVTGFVPTTTTSSRLRQQSRHTSDTTLSFFFNNNDNGDGDDEETFSDTTTPLAAPTTSAASVGVWSPGLRKTMAGVASVGALETAYLTYVKLVAKGSPTLFCGSSQAAASSCDKVLNGPYSNLPFVEGVPLAALGFVAYCSVIGLALWPLLVSTGTARDDDEKTDSLTVAVDDTQNRILLTALATAMGTFSIFLVTLLGAVLKASCPYCLVSAADSFFLANLALIGGCLPESEELDAVADDTRRGVVASGGRTVAAGFAGSAVGAVLLFGSGSLESINANAVGGGGGGGGSTLLATTLSGGSNAQPQEMIVYAPPEITLDSSPKALAVAKRLKELDAKMYGAHWCSHCYDQKQALGKQAFGQGFVQYVECSKDGLNSQTKVCKTKEIPGYPTWEINGKQYPGEQTLEELEELIQGLATN